MTHVIPENEIAPVRDLVNEVVGSEEFDASTYAKKCFVSYTHDRTGISGAVAKSYAIECSYAESDDQKQAEEKMFPQLSLVISKLPIAQKQQ